MSEASANSQDLLAAMNVMVVSRATHDPAFRAALVSNPRAAIEALFEIALPAHIKLQTVEQPSDTYMIVLPVAPAVGTDGELSDGDLEAVAGGAKAGADEFFGDVTDRLRQTGSSLAGQGVGAVLGQMDMSSFERAIVGRVVTNAVDSAVCS